MKLFRCLLSAIVLISTITVYGESLITPNDYMGFRFPQSLAVSPDGNQIAYTVRSADFTDKEWRIQLWMHRKNSTNEMQLTFVGFENDNPQWSPDGQWLTFLSDRQNLNSDSTTTQIWALPMSGGEAHQWTASETDIDDYQWMPDGSAIVYLADQDPGETKTSMLNTTVKDSLSISKVFYLKDIKSNSSRTIAVIDPGVNEFDISPDGHWIVYETNYTGEYNDDQKFDLWILNIQTGKTYQFTDYPGPETDPQFSPDGKRIAYLNQTTPDVEFAEHDLAWCKFSPEKAAQDTATLTRDFDHGVQAYRWKSDNTFILQFMMGMQTSLNDFKPDDSNNRYNVLTPETGNTSDFVLTPGKQKQLYYLWEDATHLPEIATLKKDKQQLLTNYSDQLKPFDTGSIQQYSWKSVDGKTIEGLLFTPPNFDKNKKYPLILTVHGGPYGRFEQNYYQYYFPQMYTSRGYVVFAPNPRGGSGYGDAFSKAIWHEKGGHMGGIDYQDIMSGVDALIQNGIIDTTRMGVVGGSYGGYMTNWIISQTNRFSAAVSMYGIFSLFTDWSNSWQPSWEKMYFGEYYWEQPINMENPYVKYSPAFYVTNIHTPVLILHGTKDKYTNLSNSQEMYQALHTLGREVKFVVYSGEHHGLSRWPNDRRDIYRRALQWFDTHLKSD